MFKWIHSLFGKRRPTETNGGSITVNLETGKQTPTKETPKGKLYDIIASNECPDCGKHDGFYEGPSGGMSINIKCANPECKAKFNVTPVIGIAERI